jgi:hypothetical protein
LKHREKWVVLMHSLLVGIFFFTCIDVLNKVMFGNLDSVFEVLFLCGILIVVGYRFVQFFVKNVYFRSVEEELSHEKETEV